MMIVYFFPVYQTSPSKLEHGMQVVLVVVFNTVIKSTLRGIEINHKQHGFKILDFYVSLVC